MALVRKPSPQDLAARAKPGLVPAELWSNLAPRAWVRLPLQVPAARPEEAGQGTADAEDASIRAAEAAAPAPRLTGDAIPLESPDRPRPAAVSATAPVSAP
jgi:hypothetical protein